MANWFTRLSPARQESIINEFRAGVRELGDAIRAAGPPGAVHQPYTGRHAHPHYDGSGRQHAHVHEHDGDADHGHDHDEIDAAVRSAEAAKRSSQARRRPVVLNSARQARSDDAWERLAWTARKIQQGKER